MWELFQPSGMWGLEVCFVGLVVGRNYVWCIVIFVIFMEFGQAWAKRCEGCLKVINWGCRSKSQKGGFFHREGRFSVCYAAALSNFTANLTGYILKRFYWIPLLTTLLLFYVFEVGKAKNSKCPDDVTTEWAIPKPFVSFLLYPWKFQTKQGFTPRNSL